MTETLVADSETVSDVEFNRPWSEEVLPLDALRIDRHYQRETKTTLVNTIAAAYDLALAGFIVVNRRKNGHLYVIDGQQRKAGAEKAGEQEILARVFEELDTKTEAQYYDKLNDTKPQLTHERFKAAYAAGDPQTHRIYQIVHSFGATIYGVDGKGEDAITAIAALRWIYSQGGERGLSRTLSIIRRAFEEIHRETTPAAFLKSVFYAIDRHEEIDDGRLAHRIQETGMIALKQQAMAFATRSADATGYYVALLDTYNHRLSERKRLSPIFRRKMPEDE
jgi:ribosomal protein L29